MRADPDRVDVLLTGDRYARLLGIEREGTEGVVVRLRVERHHLNFFDVTHGGVVFSLADCAFSLACNLAEDRAVAIDTHLVLTGGTKEGDVLVAVAEEATRGRTLGTYRVTVRRQGGRVVGLFTGTAHITPRA